MPDGRTVRKSLTNSLQMPSICQYPVFRWTDDINTLGFVLKTDMILVADLLPTDLSDI